MHKYAPALAAVALLAVGLVGISYATATAVALSPTADGTLIQNDDGAVANGSGPHFRAGTNGLSWAMRAPIRFDVAAQIPAGSTIDRVTLILHQSGAQTAPHPIALHRLLAAWGEGGSVSGGGQGVPSAPGDATWIHRFYNPAAPADAPAWQLPGGDFAGESGASTEVAGVGYYSWSSVGLAQDVQMWLDRPDLNHGWLLIGDETSPGTVKKFASREAEDRALRPLLLIEHSPIAPDDDEGDDEAEDRPHKRR